MFKFIILSLVIVFVYCDMTCEYTCKNGDEVVINIKTKIDNSGTKEVQEMTTKNVKPKKTQAPKLIEETKPVVVGDDMMFLGCYIHNTTALNRFLNSGCDEEENKHALLSLLANENIDKSNYMILNNPQFGYATCNKSLKDTPQCHQLQLYASEQVTGENVKFIDLHGCKLYKTEQVLNKAECRYLNTNVL